MTTEAFHKWSLLPKELQLQVLENNVHQHGSIDKSTHTKLSQETHEQPNISNLFLCGNHELSTLAQETYYNVNQFEIDLYDDGPYGPKPSRARLIRNLHLIMFQLMIKSDADADPGSKYLPGRN